ncbi:hypothetical protein [Nitrospirillum sp. BR 11163]|uniref:hypothetical protein n=1 Tax=Nitrospirillum sp. BR 11163 TaxID=3104323 RepID=UPI002AFEADFE|nr:hypothetical protein [Nitrospirillum sp. BR 11163]MEA1675979.1 hypothetical protein [Nitrospirillum sp. BR 11163]
MRSYAWGVMVAALLTAPLPVAARAADCPQPLQIVGLYQCTGECVVTAGDGTQSVTEVAGETNTIQPYPGSKHGLYRISIQAAGFTETEVGPLHGQTLYTATSQVSDGHYPVLEDYLFDVKVCRVHGYTKIVRNPSQATYKSCAVQCVKAVQ